MFDTWRPFLFSADSDIPPGEYELFDGTDGDEKTLVLFDKGPHTHTVIQYLLDIKQITFQDINRIKPVVHVLPADTFKALFEYFYEGMLLPKTAAKSLICTYIGQLSKLTFKQNYCLVSQDKTYCDMSYNEYTSHGFNVQYINHIDCELIVLLIQKITPNLMTATPIWNQFIEGGKICLSKMAYSLIHNTPNAIVWAVNTDSVTVQNPNEAVLQEAREYPKYSSNGHSPLDSIGKLKIEDTIKIRGKQLSVVMAKSDSNPCGNLTKTPNENTLYTADG